MQSLNPALRKAARLAVICTLAALIFALSAGFATVALCDSTLSILGKGRSKKPDRLMMVRLEQVRVEQQSPAFFDSEKAQNR